MDERKSHKWIWILLGIIVLLLIVIFGFRITEITVEGNTFYSEDEVKTMVCKDVTDKNTIALFIKEKLGFQKEMPFVREYKIRFQGISKIHIIFYEKSIVAGVHYMNEYIYFDKEGLVLESSGAAKEGIPLFEVSGLTNFSLYENLELEDKNLLKEMLNLSNLMVHYSIPADRVLFNARNEAVLYSGEVKVLLGEKANYDDVIAALQSVLTTSAEKKLSGEIDMTNYKNGDDIILKKN